MNVPNLISCFRLAAPPVLLYLAWHGHARFFLVLLVAAFLSDKLDGYIARKFHQVSELGAKLDSWGDFAIYMTIPLSAWWLWPGLIRQEAPFIIAAMASYCIPKIIGFLKFGCLTSYHTVGAKISVFLMCVTVLILFVGGFGWPFRLATPIFVLAALEDIAISVVLSKPRSDVPSLWHAMHKDSL